MTVAIAAACRDKGDPFQPRIVIGFDSKISTSLHSSETAFKIEDLAPSPFAAMFAGNISGGRELIDIYRTYLAEHYPRDNTPSLSDIQEQLRQPLWLRKRRMTDAFVQRRLGMSYEEFCGHKEWVDTSLWISMFNEINSITLDAVLLLVGFRKDHLHPCMLFTTAWDDVGSHLNFACIGDGAAAAEFSLHARAQYEHMDVIRTLYHVYEAKRASETAPTVGKAFVLGVAVPSALEHYEINFVSKAMKDQLKSWYGELGPKKVTELEVPDGLDMFEPLNRDVFREPS
jgi:hypothetical protein